MKKIVLREVKLDPPDTLTPINSEHDNSKNGLLALLAKEWRISHSWIRGMSGLSASAYCFNFTSSLLQILFHKEVWIVM